MVLVSDSWRKADTAQRAVHDAVKWATLAAVAGDREMAALWLHSARRSAEVLVEHLASAADEMMAGATPDPEVADQAGQILAPRDADSAPVA